MEPLSPPEIFDLAAEIAEKIKCHLNQVWYDKSEITLSILWSTNRELSATATLSPSLEVPTRHIITMTYDLIEQIYSEALDFPLFGMGDKHHASGTHMIPKQFGLLQAAEFMFESGITFLIFHELGHINQTTGPYVLSIVTLQLTPRVPLANLMLALMPSALPATELASSMQPSWRLTMRLWTGWQPAYKQFA